VARIKPAARVTGAAALAAALAVELIDEFVDGTKGAAFPLIRHDLGLSYGQIGLLASVPLLLGSLLELPVGVLAGHGRRQRVMVLAGGAAFIASLAMAAFARSFPWLLTAFVVFFVASGAFVTLTQSGLMAADPVRQEQHMARWDLAGSAGAVAGPLLLIAVLAGGGSWRTAYLVLAVGGAVAWLAIARCGGQLVAPPVAAALGQPGAASPARRVGRALRQGGVARCIVLLQVADLLLDVLTGFLALYLVDVEHASPEQAALAVAVRLVAGLAGDGLLVQVLEHVSGTAVLRAGTAAAVVLYPAFLLVPGIWPKLTVMAALSIATAPLYPLLQARLYGLLPGQSGVVVTLSSAAGLVGAAGPLAVGFLAERFGLAWALGTLALVGPALLAGLGPGWHGGDGQQDGELPVASDGPGPGGDGPGPGGEG
jgi:FSR family fosmidomycin resistance protein-like MFS transporter